MIESALRGVFFWWGGFRVKINHHHQKDFFMGFMFQNSGGAFCDPQYVPVISEYALELLRTYAQQTTVPVPHQEACLKFLEVVDTLPVVKTHSSTLKNDEPNPTLNDWSSKPGEYHFSYKNARVMVEVGSARTRFQPMGNEGIAPHVSTWGWEQMASLLPYCAALKSVSKALDITIETKIIRLASRLWADWQSGGLTLREESVDQDLAQSSAWIIFDQRNQKYVDAQWYSAALSAAKLFPSKELALHAIKKSRHSNADFVPVEVSMQIASLDLATLDDQKSAPLMQAYSIIQKEKIEEALRQADVEQLRARLAALEGTDPAQPLSGDRPKKRM